MQVTADTLFHFTSSFSNLKGILTDRFKISYCHEKYSLDYQLHDSYYPMVCFCDLPLALAKRHINSYGQYAIGLTKEWAIKNHLNPVVYVEKGSLLATGIQNGLDRSVDLAKLIGDGVYSVKDDVVKEARFLIAMLEESLKDWNINKEKANTQMKSSHKYIVSQGEVVQRLGKILDYFSVAIGHNMRLFSYIKNYQDVLETSDKVIKNYRFYDEREWRFVPTTGDNVKQWLTPEEYKKFRGTSARKPFIKGTTLSFQSSDIKYLIVRSEKEIPGLIRTIKKIDSLYKNVEAADILSTKILTVDQLNLDF